MMRNKLVDEKQRQERVDAKTLDNQFRRRIEEGANCSPFVSQAILKTLRNPGEITSRFQRVVLGSSIWEERRRTGYAWFS
jgi:hypothetical protein